MSFYFCTYSRKLTATLLSLLRGFNSDSIVISNQVGGSSEQKDTKHIESVKHKHVFLDLCSKGEKKNRAVETGCIIQLEENMFSVSTMEQELPLRASTMPCDCRERQRDFLSARVVLRSVLTLSLYVDL